MDHRETERVRYLVRWRDGEGRTRSYMFSVGWSPEWGDYSPEAARSRTRELAEEWKAEKARTERRSMSAVKRLPA